MRPTVEAIYHNTTIRMTFDDMETAKASYDKISEALGDYKMFRNERKETINVETSCGCCTTLRLERLDALFLNSVDGIEQGILENLEDEKRVRTMRLNMGLPSIASQPSEGDPALSVTVTSKER